jgi:hypothetical protein
MKKLRQIAAFVLLNTFANMGSRETNANYVVGAGFANMRIKSKVAIFAVIVVSMANLKDLAKTVGGR